MRKTSSWILVIGLLLVPASPSFAQTFGQITGQVTDGSGAMLVGTSVTVTNPQTGAVRSAETNSAGSYVFPNLLPGIYNIRVDLQGFQSKVVNSVELQVQQTIRQDFVLELGSVEEAVIVTGSAPLINTADATVGTVIENRQILDLPLNGRNFINLISLSQNVSSDYAGGTGGGASGRQGGDRATQNFSIAGQRREYNNYTLDGIVNQDVNFNTYAFLPSIDVVEEFKVQTGVYSSEFGREAAQVNVSTKSGTNLYHGTVFEFLRNDAFDARPYAFHERALLQALPSNGTSSASRWVDRSRFPGCSTARTSCSSCRTTRGSGCATSSRCCTTRRPSRCAPGTFRRLRS